MPLVRWSNAYSRACYVTLERGWFVGFKDALIGQSHGDRSEDHADTMAHEAYARKLEDEALAKARAQRNYQRALAQEALDQALAKEDQMRDSLKTACKALSDSKFQLLQAEENLSRTKLDLQRLGAKVVELVCHNSDQVQPGVNNGQR